MDDFEFTLDLLVTPKDKQPQCPKVLADMYEGMIGAILIDCKGNLELIWEIIKNDFILTQSQIQSVIQRLQSFKEIQTHLGMQVTFNK